jgi:SAM-dependent methyltransferase
MNLTVTPSQANSIWYRRALRYELFSGRVANPIDQQNSSLNNAEIIAYKGRILGHRQSLDDRDDWTRFLLDEYGTRKRCLSLGSGLGRVEQYLLKIGFTDKFDAIELCANENDLMKIEEDNMKVLGGDLNFAELPENTYDFVLCHDSLHHLINLEFILEQINRSLKPDGILLVCEYVGETRWQFTPERMNFLRKMFPHLEFRVPELWEVRGFESVRSGDLLGLINQQFGDSADRSVSYGGVYFPLLICAPTHSDQDIKLAVEADAKVSSDRSLSPCYHMGVYRKSQCSPATASKWTDDDLREKLAPPSPFADRAMMSLKQSSLGSALRAVKRAIRL